MSSKFLNLDTDNTLGGVNTSDSRVASQKAVKDYVDTNIPTVTSVYTASGTDAVNGVAVSNAIATKQDILVSGTSIKTLNGNNLLGSGNIVIEASSTPDVDGDTISYNTDNELQTIGVINQRDGSALKIWHGTQAQWNQGESIPWYYWQTSINAMWTGSTMPSSANWGSLAYGDGKFVAVVRESKKLAYSTNGINWTETATLPRAEYWNSVAYGDGKFVVVALGSKRSAYSTDGINWTESNLLSSVNWVSIRYCNGIFMVVAEGSDKLAYSTDGINWAETTLPFSGYWSDVAYGNGKFVAVAWGPGQDQYAYSTDGINWTKSTMPSPARWYSVAYGDGKFVAVAGYSDKAAYSTDGVNWTPSTLPSSTLWKSLAYGDGKFVVITGTGNTASAYSTDGINWTSSTLPSSNAWRSLAYGDGKFVAIAESTNISAYFTMSYSTCFTNTQTPTTTSAIYSAPDTASTLTVSSVTSGAITLSDNNTYYYNQSGNQYTYSTVGEAHSDWLCFIDGVGIKIGTTTIATNS